MVHDSCIYTGRDVGEIVGGIMEMPKNCSRCGSEFKETEWEDASGGKHTTITYGMWVSVGTGVTDERYPPGEYAFCVSCLLDVFLGDGR